VLESRFLPQLGDDLTARSESGRFPLSGQWELTCRCNLHCVMCYTDPFNTSAKIRQELRTEEIFRILHELRDEGCLELTLTGGEPLARPDFEIIYKEAVACGLLITVFTNGTLIQESILSLWTHYPPRGVEISLHSLSDSVFDGITQKSGSLARCRKAIQQLHDRKISLTLKAVVMPSNRNDILAVKKYAEDLGPGVSFKLAEYLRDDLAASGGPFQFQLPENDLREMAQQDSAWWNEKQGPAEEVLPSTGCRSGEQNFHIDAYGQLQLCSGNRRAGYDLRNGSFREGFYQALPSFPCPMKGARRPVAVPC
jgi:MoaA/NifB/PqqE/SkfB family radical SAM enzyme